MLKNSLLWLVFSLLTFAAVAAPTNSPRTLMVMPDGVVVAPTNFWNANRSNVVSSQVEYATNAGLAGAVSGALTNPIPATNLTGTIPLARLPAPVLTNAALFQPASVNGSNIANFDGGSLTNVQHALEADFAWYVGYVTNFVSFATNAQAAQTSETSSNATVAGTASNLVAGASLTNVTASGTFTGSGAGLTDLKATNISGVIPTNNLPMSQLGGAAIGQPIALFLGDSMSDAGGIPGAFGYVAQLLTNQNYAYKVGFVNKAISGNTAAADLAYYVTRIQPILSQASGRPVIVYDWLGYNDVATAPDANAGITAKSNLWAALKTNNIRLVAMTAYDSQVSKPNVLALNTWIRSHTNMYDDLVDVMALSPRTWQDTIHPDAAFCTLLASQINLQISPSGSYAPSYQFYGQTAFYPAQEPASSYAAAQFYGRVEMRNDAGIRWWDGSGASTGIGASSLYEGASARLEFTTYAQKRMAIEATGNTIISKDSAGSVEPHAQLFVKGDGAGWNCIFRAESADGKLGVSFDTNGVATFGSNVVGRFIGDGSLITGVPAQYYVTNLYVAPSSPFTRPNTNSDAIVIERPYSDIGDGTGFIDFRDYNSDGAYEWRIGAVKSTDKTMIDPADYDFHSFGVYYSPSNIYNAATPGNLMMKFRQNGDVKIRGQVASSGLMLWSTNGVPDGVTNGAMALISSNGVPYVFTSTVGSMDTTKTPLPINTFVGNGSGLTGLNATNLTGTVPPSNLPGNWTTNNGNNFFTAGQTVTGSSTNAGDFRVNGSLSGSGSAAFGSGTVSGNAVSSGSWNRCGASDYFQWGNTGARLYGTSNTVRLLDVTGTNAASFYSSGTIIASNGVTALSSTLGTTSLVCTAAGTGSSNYSLVAGSLRSRGDGPVLVSSSVYVDGNFVGNIGTSGFWGGDRGALSVSNGTFRGSVTASGTIIATNGVTAAGGIFTGDGSGVTNINPAGLPYLLQNSGTSNLLTGATWVTTAGWTNNGDGSFSTTTNGASGYENFQAYLPNMPGLFMLEFDYVSKSNLVQCYLGGNGSASCLISFLGASSTSGGLTSGQRAYGLGSFAIGTPATNLFIRYGNGFVGTISNLVLVRVR